MDPLRLLFSKDFVNFPETTHLSGGVRVVRDESGHTLVSVDLPGVQEKDVRLVFTAKPDERKYITVSAVRSDRVTSLLERRSSSGSTAKDKATDGGATSRFTYTRTLVLPDHVAPKELTADFKDGVLTLTIAPKPRKAIPKGGIQIPIGSRL